VLARFLIVLALLIGAGYLSYEGYRYAQVRDLLPPGSTIGGIDVSGLTLAEAGERVYDAYMAPVTLIYRSERVELMAEEAGLQLDLETMLRSAQSHQEAMAAWEGYVSYLLNRPVDSPRVPLEATIDSAQLTDVVTIVANLLDRPAADPTVAGAARVFASGEPGYVADIPASLPAVESALLRPEQREASLVIIDQEAVEPDMSMLRSALQTQLAEFDGIASVFVMDLQSGEEIGINADMAMSGISIMKIAIMLEAFRNYFDGTPAPYEWDLFQKTAAESSDWAANLLLDRVANQDNAYLGVDILTASMQRLGLENTFIATPYQEPERPERLTYTTPANTRDDAIVDLDRAMQTTAEDMGTLLSMIYACANGGGSLLAVYPDQLSDQECTEILDVMKLNVEGNLIRYGVPEGIDVAHKHGWAGGTHGDAGIVFTPGGDYVLVEFLYQPGGWLVADYSFPILREISRTVYNYFNADDPFLGDRTLVLPSDAAQPAAGEVEAEATPAAPATPPNDEAGASQG
jgi:beta-lactamase class A